MTTRKQEFSEQLFRKLFAQLGFTPSDYTTFELNSLLKIRMFDRAAIFNSTAETIYWVEEGIAQSSYWKNDHQVVLNLFQEGDVISNIIVSRSPEITMEALFPLKLIEINMRLLHQLSKENASHALLQQFLLERQLQQLQANMLQQVNLKAVERYQILLEQQPQLLNRLSQKQIAAYLGITPVSLSRIKNRLAQ